MPRTRVVAYLRVSTSKQADEGQSLEAQREKIVAYCKVYDLDLVDVIVDAGESASSLDRPGLRRALAMLGWTADGLLVVKLDRLTRSVRDLGELVERFFGPNGAALLSVSDAIDTRTAAGRLVLNVLASVSQWEREAIGERTSSTMQSMSSRGLFVGGEPPFGYTVGADGVLVPVLAEQAVITLARDLRAGGLSFSRVARFLGERGHVSRTGRPFDGTQVRRMLARSAEPSAAEVPEPSATFRAAAEDES